MRSIKKSVYFSQTFSRNFKRYSYLIKLKKCIIISNNLKFFFFFFFLISSVINITGKSMKPAKRTKKKFKALTKKDSNSKKKFKALTKKDSNSKKKFKALTKKQKKKLRMKKANKIIFCSSNLFETIDPEPRNASINPWDVGSEKLIHDGYSWNRCIIPVNSVSKKFGTLAFKTRALSPISLFEKGGVKKLSMAQVSTYKLKNPKVKRKK